MKTLVAKHFDALTSSLFMLTSPGCDLSIETTGGIDPTWLRPLPAGGELCQN